MQNSACYASNCRHKFRLHSSLYLDMKHIQQGHGPYIQTQDADYETSLMLPNPLAWQHLDDQVYVELVSLIRWSKHFRVQIIEQHLL